MSKRIEKRFVIHNSESLLDISRAISEMLWRFDEEIDATDTKPYQQIWMKLDSNGNRLAFLYIEDKLIGVRYFKIRGFDQDAVDEAVEELKEQIKTYSMEDIRKQINETKDDQDLVALTNKMFIAAPDSYDSHAFSLLEKLFHHPSANVQKAAILASAYVSWPELRTPLEELKKGQTEVGKEAGRMIELLEKHNWGIS